MPGPERFAANLSGQVDAQATVELASIATADDFTGLNEDFEIGVINMHEVGNFHLVAATSLIVVREVIKADSARKRSYDAYREVRLVKHPGGASLLVQGALLIPSRGLGDNDTQIAIRFNKAHNRGLYTMQASCILSPIDATKQV